MTKNLPVAITCLIEDAAKPDPTGALGLDSSDILLDPTAQEESESCRGRLFVLVTESQNPSRLLATQSVSIGSRASATKKATMKLPNILACAQATSRSNQAVLTFWRLAIEQRSARELQTLWSSS